MGDYVATLTGKILHSSINYMTRDQCELLARNPSLKSLTFRVQDIDIRPHLQ